MQAAHLVTTIDLVVETAVSTSTRARQVCSMFDVPPEEKCRKTWRCEFPYDAEPWNVGLFVGPSGSGKSSVMRHLWGDMPALEWGAPSVVDDVKVGTPVQEISESFGAVGFNTIPAWLRPFAVLSNGEKFRVDLARRLIEIPDPIVVDEFTSVVDRQVAQIGSHAVQKIIRKRGRKFVAVTCHYDVLDWLQPDWVLDVSTMSFTRRLLQRRPGIECEIKRVPRAVWRRFAPFHYLTADLHRSARCFGLWANGRLAAFAGMLHMPHAQVDDIMRCSRLVTLPDFQGLGLAFALIDKVGAAYRGIGKRARTYPAHPALTRAFDRSPLWSMEKTPGGYSTATKTSATSATSATKMGTFGARPCAVFQYAGPAMEHSEAAALIGVAA